MKPFSVKFKVDAHILAIIYTCFRYKFPLSFMLSFYEMYGPQTLFILKAMSCTKKITLNDNTLIKIIEESKLLHKQIIAGISTNIKREQLIKQLKNGKIINEVIPDCPEINVMAFTDDYRQFVESYLLKNIVDIFNEELELKMDCNDLYVEITK